MAQQQGRAREPVDGVHVVRKMPNPNAPRGQSTSLWAVVDTSTGAFIHRGMFTRGAACDMASLLDEAWRKGRASMRQVLGPDVRVEGRP